NVLRPAARRRSPEPVRHHSGIRSQPASSHHSRIGELSCRNSQVSWVAYVQVTGSRVCHPFGAPGRSGILLTRISFLPPASLAAFAHPRHQPRVQHDVSPTDGEDSPPVKRLPALVTVRGGGI